MFTDKLKRLFVTLMALCALAGCLAGCGKTDGPEVTTEPDAPSEPLTEAPAVPTEPVETLPPEGSYSSEEREAEYRTIVATKGRQAIVVYDPNGGQLGKAFDSAKKIKDVSGVMTYVRCNGYFYQSVVDSHYICPHSVGDFDYLKRDGYVLYGYNTRADGLGDYYGLGWNLPVEKGEVFVLYAMWAKETPASSFKIKDNVIISYKDTEDVVVIPNGVTEIGTGAFSNCKMHTVIMPKSVSSINSKAFNNCKSLKNVYQYDLITDMPANSFNGCDAFTQLYLNNANDISYLGTMKQGSYMCKFQRLFMMKDKKKIVLIGGSNLCYGLDSAMLKGLLNNEYEIINWGTMYQIPASFFIDVTSHFVNEGDIVLTCPEEEPWQWGQIWNGDNFKYYDYLWYSCEGCPEVFSYIDMVKYRKLLPNIATMNGKRMGGTCSYESFYATHSVNEYGDFDNERTQSARKKTDSYGKLTGWGNTNYADWIGASRRAGFFTAENVASLTESFNACIAKGAKIYISYSVTDKYYFSDTSEATAKAYDADVDKYFASKNENIFRISNVYTYMFDDSKFYNSMHHLLLDAARERTQLLYKDIRAQLDSEKGTGPAVTTAPVVTTAKPIVTTAPVVTTAKPIVTTSPVITTAKPVVTTSPVITTAKPIVTTAPVITTSKPIVTTAPVITTAKPIVTTAPVVTTAKPIVTTSPVITTEPVPVVNDKTVEAFEKLTVAKNQFLVVYDYNGGQAGSSFGSSGTISDSATHKISVTRYDTYFTQYVTDSEYICPHSMGDKGYLKRDGYVLYGYNTKPDGSGDYYACGWNVPVSKGQKILLYAQWKQETPKSDFTISGTVIKSYNGKAETVVIPSGITEIASGAFNASPVVTVYMPKSVATVNSKAFLNCKSLTTVYFYDLITTMPDDAFEGCDSFSQIYMSNANNLKYQTGYKQGSYMRKFQRLMMNSDKKKIILIGGSNLCYGLNSELLKGLLNNEYEIINYGTMYYIPSVFFVDVASKYVRDGDIIITCPEEEPWQWGKVWNGTDMYYSSYVGYSCEGAPEVLSAVDMRVYRNLLSDIASINKARVGGVDSYESLNASEHVNEYGDFIYDRTQTARKKTDSNGKLTGWANTSYTDWIGESRRATFFTDSNVSNLMRAFNACIDNGAQIFISYSVTDRYYFKDDSEATAKAYDADVDKYFSSKSDKISRISDFSDYLFDDSKFFNSMHHLLDEAADERTRLLYSDIKAQLDKQ